MREGSVHPLKKAAIKPSSSTLRGMLNPREFKIVDSTLQSLRSAGARELAWEWKGKDVGWICAARYNNFVLCEVHAAQDPIKGVIPLNKAFVSRLQSCQKFPNGYKTFLSHPVSVKDKVNRYELALETTEFRDLLSSLVGAILLYVE